MGRQAAGIFRAPASVTSEAFERTHYNRKTKKNEIVEATHRAVDMIPKDILIMDWYYSINGGGHKVPGLFS